MSCGRSQLLIRDGGDDAWASEAPQQVSHPAAAVTLTTIRQILRVGRRNKTTTQTNRQTPKLLTSFKPQPSPVQSSPVQSSNRRCGAAVFEANGRRQCATAGWELGNHDNTPSACVSSALPWNGIYLHPPPNFQFWAGTKTRTQRMGQSLTGPIGKYTNSMPIRRSLSHHRLFLLLLLLFLLRLLRLTHALTGRSRQTGQQPVSVTNGNLLCKTHTHFTFQN